MRSISSASSLLLCLVVLACSVALALAAADPPAPAEGFVATRAELVTCSGCQLNRLPITRDFVYNKQTGMDSYERASVKFHQGHTPELVFYNDAAEVERIDIRQYDAPQLASIMIDRGFKSAAAATEQAKDL